MKDFLTQIKDAELVVVNKPRTYIKWNNSEFGRDKNDCYERIDNNGFIHYVNTYNTNSKIFKGEPFFEALEEIFNNLINSKND